MINNDNEQCTKHDATILGMFDTAFLRTSTSIHSWVLTDIEYQYILVLVFHKIFAIC